MTTDLPYALEGVYYCVNILSTLDYLDVIDAWSVFLGGPSDHESHPALSAACGSWSGLSIKNVNCNFHPCVLCRYNLCASFW